MQSLRFSMRRLLKSLRMEPLSAPRGRRAKKFPPMMELLEERRLLSATLDSGILTLNGNDAGNKISIKHGDNPGDVIVNGVPEVAANQLFEGVDQIIINASGGNDTVTIGKAVVDTNGLAINVTVNGGTGNDKLTGGDGDDDLNGGSGHDDVRGNNGNDDFSVDGSSEIHHRGHGDDGLNHT